MNHRKYLLPGVIAITHWLICQIFGIDRLFFFYEGISYAYILVKFLFLIFLVAGWEFLFYVVTKVKKGDEEFRWGVLYFVLYFLFTICIIIIIWPGAWAWDDLYTLLNISGYKSLDPWHHVFTGTYQAILLQLLPFPTGILILQNMIISGCVSFVILKMEMLFGLKRTRNPFVILLKFLPFMFPPVFAVQFSGYRMGIYVYVELLFLTMLISNQKFLKNNSYIYLLFFSFICILVSVWRTESFFYFICACFLILVSDKGFMSFAKKLITIFLIVMGFFFTSLWQKTELKNNDYMLINFVNPCIELVRYSNVISDEKELYSIDKVLDLDVIHRNPQLTGERMYWYKNLKKTYTKQEYKEFLRAFIKLCIKYPKVFIAERWNTFLRGVELSEKGFLNLYGAARLYDDNDKNEAMKLVKEKGWIGIKPISREIRKKVISWGMGINEKGQDIHIYRRLSWNIVIPMLIILYIWIKSLTQRKWNLFIIFSALIIKIPIVFWIEPEGNTQYFLIFGMGYIILSGYIIKLLDNHNKNQNNKVKLN